MTTKAKFDITPKQQASMGAYLRRQLFVTPPPVTPRDANLVGQTAIITGANTGIGLETARQLLDLGLTKLILAVRDEAKGAAAKADLEATYAGTQSLAKNAIEVWHVDLASYLSVVALAERAKTLPRLDIAILNAGLFKKDESFEETTGYETDVLVNYLSAALLSLLLLPTLADASASLSASTGTPTPTRARLVLLSSDMAAWAKFPERNANPLLPTYKRAMAPQWDMAERYSVSKLLGQMFVHAMARRVKPTEVRVSTVNPGFCHGSELQREGKGSLIGLAFRIAARVLGRPAAIGARSATAAAAAAWFGDEAHGEYVEDGRLRPSAPLLYTPEGWRLSEQLWEETLDEFSFANVRDAVSRFEKHA